LKETTYTLSKRQQMLAASALVPIIGALGQPATLQALIYTFFVAVYLLPLLFKANPEGNPPGTATTPPGKATAPAETSRAAQAQQVAESETRRLPAVQPAKASLGLADLNFALALIASGLAGECLAWVSEFFDAGATPAPIHPQFFADLFLGLFFYLGLAVAWLLLVRRFHFALKELFLVCFLAALIKQAQLGALPAFCERLVSDPVSALLTLATWLVVGGSVTSVAFLASDKVCAADKKADLPRLLTKYLISLILIALLPELTCIGGSVIARPLGLCPDKKPTAIAPLI
jgi:hypothetical protein